MRERRAAVEKKELMWTRMDNLVFIESNRLPEDSVAQTESSHVEMPPPYPPISKELQQMIRDLNEVPWGQWAESQKLPK
jgi:hypothetical protein